MEKKPKGHQPKRHLKLWISIFIVWCLVFGILLATIGAEESIEKLLRLNVFYLFLSIFTFALSVAASILDWALLVSFLKIKTRLRNLSKIMLAGLFIDNVLPNISPTGEITMGYLLHKKENVPLSKSLASIVAYMISWFFGFILFAIIVLISLLLVQGIPLEGAVLISILIIPFVIILIALVYISINAKLCEKLVVSVVRKIFKYVLRFSRLRRKEKKTILWVRQTIKSFSKVFKTYFKRKSVIYFSCLWMAFHHFLVASSFYFMIAAFGGDVSFVAAAGVFVTLSIITLLSMVPGQLGIYEVLAISILSSLSMGLVDSTLVINLVRIVQYWSIVFIGGFFAIKLGLESLKFDR